MTRVYRSGVYPMREIAARFDVRYITDSSAVNRFERELKREMCLAGMDVRRIRN